MSESQPADQPNLETIFDLAKPNARGMFFGSYYRSNSAGFRGPEYTERPGKDVFRIVIVEDSITMGQGVREEDTYSAILQKLLNDSVKDRRFEVLNLGLSAMNIEHSAHRLESIGLRFQPDFVIYGFTPNDIELPAYRATVTVPQRRAERGRYYRPFESRSYVIRALYPRFLGLRDILFPAPGSYVYDLRENYLDNPAVWVQFLGGLDRIATASRKAGACLHVLIHTQLYAVNFLHPFHPIYAKVTEAAAARGLTVTNPFHRFEGHDERTLTLAADDPHPNAAGHRILASALYFGLRESPALCWKNAYGMSFVPVRTDHHT